MGSPNHGWEILAAELGGPVSATGQVMLASPHRVPDSSNVNLNLDVLLTFRWHCWKRNENLQAVNDEAEEIRRRIELLTPREHEILRYVVLGMLNKQIAWKLGIAEATVKIHRARIMEKLRAASIADLVRLAEKAGIEPPQS